MAKSWGGSGEFLAEKLASLGALRPCGQDGHTRFSPGKITYNPVHNWVTWELSKRSFIRVPSLSIGAFWSHTAGLLLGCPFSCGAVLEPRWCFGCLFFSLSGWPFSIGVIVSALHGPLLSPFFLGRFFSRVDLMVDSGQSV